MKKHAIRLQKRLQKVVVIAVAVILSLTPLMLVRHASAYQLTSRSLSISTAKPGATSVQYTFNFVLGLLTGTSDVEGIKIATCTTAVGACNGTAGTDTPDLTSASFVSQNGNWQGATNFSVDATGANDCLTGNRVICLKRTDSTNQTTSTTRQIVLGGIINSSTANSTFFMRIYTYDNNTWDLSGGANHSLNDLGTVASSITQTLTVNAAVAEVLGFCVGSTTVNNATSSVASDCTGVSGSSLNIGTLDTTATNVSPVSTNGGDGKNGVAMLRTNAGNGVTISYKAIQQSGSNQLGTLRISGASCNASSNDATDQCIKAQGTGQGTFTAGQERFGMTIGGVNCGSVTSYACDFSNSIFNLGRDGQYDGDGINHFITDSGAVGGTTTSGYAWDDSGTEDLIASSSTVIDDEALILKFAATPSITTPFGAYSAQADFIAVATF